MLLDANKRILQTESLYVGLTGGVGIHNFFPAHSIDENAKFQYLPSYKATVNISILKQLNNFILPSLGFNYNIGVQVIGFDQYFCVSLSQRL